MGPAQSISKFLIVLLNLIIFFLILITLALSIYSFQNHLSVDSDLVIGTLFRLSFFSLFIFMIYKLKGIIITVKTGEPFCPNNIKRFYSIATSIFVLGVIDLIGNLNSHQGFVLIDTPYFVIKATSFIYILLGCLALVLAEVFKMALTIKNDHDLTI
ncbi:DUF2975 domain-containing protein [Desulfitobacterium sp. PCE1]|uniref:DUF2975 domain-containing protein n=1 Tax=Desulfitobacterium sp. PCE1 TaxID=146907 RepID=UPI0003609B6E|nr:DUF2975 domain-containing protein [Desulfitobacterium sp. PCE1]